MAFSGESFNHILSCVALLSEIKSNRLTIQMFEVT